MGLHEFFRRAGLHRAGRYDTMALAAIFGLLFAVIVVDMMVR